MERQGGCLELYKRLRKRAHGKFSPSVYLLITDWKIGRLVSYRGQASFCCWRILNHQEKWWLKKSDSSLLLRFSSIRSFRNYFQTFPGIWKDSKWRLLKDPRKEFFSCVFGSYSLKWRYSRNIGCQGCQSCSHSYWIRLTCRHEVQSKVLEFDVYLPGKKLAFEYHGPQHYEDTMVFGISSGYKGASKIEMLGWSQDNDAEKRLRAKELGVTLVEIPYALLNIWR